MKQKQVLTLLAAAAMVALIAGCKIEADPEAQQKIQENAQKTWESTKQSLDKTGKQIKQSTAQASETFRIKSALGTSDRVDTSNLSVETMGQTIYLKGSVPTQEQKDIAETMAKAIANKGYTVEDDLKVGAKPETRISDDQPVM